MVHIFYKLHTGVMIGFVFQKRINRISIININSSPPDCYNQHAKRLSAIDKHCVVTMSVT